MGGGGSDTTNVTNTGLGDEQFTTLTASQANIGTNIDTASSDAAGRFNTLDGTLSNIRGDISGVGTNLSSGFTNLQDLMGQNMEANRQGFTGVNTNINQATGQIQSGMDAGFTGVNQNLSDGFGTMDERFNRVDTAQQTAQTAIDTGFQGQTDNFNDLNTRLTDDFNAANQTMTSGFSDVGQSLNDLDTNTQNRLDTVQGNVLTGQAILDQGITGMSDAQDIYYGDLSGRQMEIQQGQDQFQSNFDDYVQRYSEDTTLANQTRADLQTGLSNAAQNIRSDVGNFAQAAATGNAAISTQLSDTDRANRDALGNLNTAVQGGFTGQVMSAQQAQQNLVTRLGNLGSMVDTVGTTLGTNTRQQYSSLMSSFDDNGNLIRSTIDSQGNTIRRSMDDQGNLIETRFDSAGKVIGQNALNIETMLANAETYQSQLTSQIGGVQKTTEGGFLGVQDALGTGFRDTGKATQYLFDAQTLSLTDAGKANLQALSTQVTGLDEFAQSQFQEVADAFDANGKLVQRSLDTVGNTVVRQIDANGRLVTKTLDRQGMVIDQNQVSVSTLLSDIGTQTGQVQSSLGDGFAGVGKALGAGFQDTTKAVSGLFDAQTSALTTQGADLLNSMSQQFGQMDQATQANFKSVASAFDKQGNLIGQTVDGMGNTITNALDAQGNLITQKFDTAGNMIEQTQLNVNDVLTATSGVGDALSRQITSSNQGLVANMEDGYSSIQSMFDGQSQTLSDQGKNLLSLGSTLATFGQDTRKQFADVASSFDAQGNLIANSTDAMGNNISRQIDTNGNLVTARIDQSGNVLDSQTTNIKQMLDTISRAQSAQGNSLTDRLSQGFASLGNEQKSGVTDLRKGQDALGKASDQGFSSLDQGLMSTAEDNMSQLQRMSTDIMAGFDANKGMLDTSARDLARVASAQTDIDMGMRQEFKQIGDAFDDTGRLIRSTVLDNGTTLSRAIDQNGNILLRQFDVTGRDIGSKVININKSLADLGQMKNYAGANVSMGNLSPAMQGQVPTSGFMSPFSITR